jgi:hypothetical protein
LEKARSIYRLLADDHQRLDEAFRRSAEAASAYAVFREGLLRHIGMEEKILLPPARAALAENAAALVSRLHLDHIALAALLVPTPTPAIIEAIRTILDRHNPLEEGPGGLYEQCDKLLAHDIEAVVSRLQNTPAVRVAPHVDSATAMESARDALRKAGYTNLI